MTCLSSYSQKRIFPKILKPDKTISLVHLIDDNWKSIKAVLKYYKSIHWLHTKHVETHIQFGSLGLFFLSFSNEAS